MGSGSSSQKIQNANKRDEQESGGRRTLRILHFNDVYNLETSTIGDMHEDEQVFFAKLLEKEPNHAWLDYDSLQQHQKDVLKKKIIGGAGHFAGKLKQLREEFPQLMVTFAGDFMGPSAGSGITKGRHMVDLLNHLGVDFACLGNHDFDYGLEGLVKVLWDTKMKYDIKSEKSKTTWIASNLMQNVIHSPGSPLLHLKKTREEEEQYPFGCNLVADHDTEFALQVPCALTQKSILTNWNGIKVGVISCSEDWTGNLSKVPKGELTCLNDIETAKTIGKQLRDLGAEVVIAINHSRVPNDKKFMREVNEEEKIVDLLLGGHDHFVYDGLNNPFQVKGETEDQGKEALKIFKAGTEFRYLFDIEIEVSGAGTDKKVEIKKSNLIPITDDIPKDPYVDQIASKWLGMINKKTSKVISHTKVQLSSQESDVRFKESTLPNFIADVVVSAEDLSSKEGTQQAHICLLDAYKVKGNNRKPVADRDITIGDMMMWFPKVANMCVFKLTPKEIIMCLEEGARKLPGECGGLFHVNKNLKYTIDVNKESDVDKVQAGQNFGQRVTGVEFNDGSGFKPIHEFKDGSDTPRLCVAVAWDSCKYSTALKKFYKEDVEIGFDPANVVVEEEYSMTLFDIVRGHFKTMQKESKSVETTVDGRITIISKE